MQTRPGHTPHPLLPRHAILTPLPKPDGVEDSCGEAPPTAVIPAGSLQQVLTHREHATWEGHGRDRAGHNHWHMQTNMWECGGRGAPGH